MVYYYEVVLWNIATLMFVSLLVIMIFILIKQEKILLLPTPKDLEKFGVGHVIIIPKRQQEIKHHIPPKIDDVYSVLQEYF